MTTTEGTRSGLGPFRLATRFVVDWAPPEPCDECTVVDDLRGLDPALLNMGRAASAALRATSRTLSPRDDLGCRSPDLIEVAGLHAEIDRRITAMIVRGPLAEHEARQALAAWQVAQQLERIGRCAAAVAALIGRSAGTRPRPAIGARLATLGEHVAALVESTVATLDTSALSPLGDFGERVEVIELALDDLFAALVDEGRDGISRWWSLLSERIARQYRVATDHTIELHDAVTELR